MSMQLYHSVMKAAAPLYQRIVGAELNKMGLRYEDLLNSSDPVIGEALELADPAIRVARQRRLKRASDLSFKGKSLTDYAPNMQLQPFKHEIYDDILKIQKRDAEVKSLNYHKL